MITARTTLPAPAFPDGPHVVALIISMSGIPIKEHKATICGGTEDPQAISSRWEAIANALIATGLHLCDQMAREAWFASICLTDDRTVRHTADRARGIVSGHIGPDHLRQIYQTAS